MHRGHAMGAILQNGTVLCGTAGFSKVTEKVVSGNGAVIAYCAPGETVTGGGFYNDSGDAISASYAYIFAGKQGWLVETSPSGGSDEARAICASR